MVIILIYFKIFFFEKNKRKIRGNGIEANIDYTFERCKVKKLEI